ncbi:hypothetical protein PMG11_05004 [Penicillium brasilianum]|uniref:RING-type E3 ubiquitin transferase n=1 Tax=Penicillium brasilianum TaxID=104259 RepID=A0A0F7VIS0_PENBI|nr:hypothetical protein PMG11_05004 [Penicillium brasilianum]
MADDGDRVICHACGGVWLLETGEDGHDNSLKCPHCESDFTEIIEIPPESPQPEHEAEPHSPPVNPWADHNPWAQEETLPPRTSGWTETGAPGYSHRSYRSPDGRFTFSTTTIGGSYSSRNEGQPDPLPTVIQNLGALFQGLAGTYDHHQTQRSSGMPPRFHAAGMREPDVMHDPFQAHHERARRHEDLFSRDPNDPQHMESPVPNLGDFIEALRGNTRNAEGAANPFSMLSALMNVDRNGDAVYSQEELDRVISQLIDHTQQGSAPPPATDSAIHSLPKKRMTREMMGPDRTAECSICMDPVEVDTEVTVLPCTHWFHFDCIKAWLSQHNTCPHCRRSIDATGVTSPGEGNSENPIIIPDSPEASSPPRLRRRSSPLTSRSTRSARSSMSRSSRTSPTPEMGESGTRRESRGESSRGGITGWVWSRFGGGGS